MLSGYLPDIDSLIVCNSIDFSGSADDSNSFQFHKCLVLFRELNYAGEYSSLLPGDFKDP